MNCMRATPHSWPMTEFPNLLFKSEYVDLYIFWFQRWCPRLAILTGVISSKCDNSLKNDYIGRHFIRYTTSIQFVASRIPSLLASTALIVTMRLPRQGRISPRLAGSIMTCSSIFVYNTDGIPLNVVSR